MAVFLPPTDNLVRYTTPDTSGVAFSLFKFYEPEPRGRNVFRLTNGTFTENEPVNPSEYTKIYWGGSKNVVTRSEGTDLENAGYTVDYLDNDVLKSAVLWLDADGY